MKRIVIVLFMSWIAILGVLFFQGCTSEQPVDQPAVEEPEECFPEPGNPVNILPVDPPSYKPDDGTFLDAGNFLTGRYHLRGRTKRFFRRVS